MNKENITQERIRGLLHYNPETGIFTWRKRDLVWFKSDRYCRAFNARFAGKQAGNVNHGGYMGVGLDNETYVLHRLAFLYMKGRFPPEQVDHINHNKVDNRWINLREATYQENQKNQSLSKANISGCTGVIWRKREQQWLAQITVDGKRLVLGLFSELKDAVAVREAANIKYGFHPNHGRNHVESGSGTDTLE